MSKQLAAAMLLDLKVEQRSIESLKPYRRTARVHYQKQIAQIAAAIRRFGFLVAILIGADGTILAGNERWQAFSKSPAVLAGGGQTFDEIRAERRGDTEGAEDGEA